jgi:3-dehydroquinate synthase
MGNNNGLEWVLETSLPVRFYIKNSPNVFSLDNEDILSIGTQGPGSRRIVVVDLKVSNLYITNIIKYLEHHEIEYHIVTLDATETNKNFDTLKYLLKEMESFGLTRKSEPVIAIGGGVLLDIVGLAASLYRRGVPYIKIPTTLLGIVDASIGVKTAINFENRRNRLGSYHEPAASFLDISFCGTLDPIEISSGLGEILKMAVVKDGKLFDILKHHGKDLYESKFLKGDYANEVINRAVLGMKEELQDNLWEKNLERLVDFGHSFSPIPEMRSLVDNNVETLTHGQAVTLDVLFSSVISHLRGLLSKDDLVDIFITTKNLGLPTYHPYFGDAHLLLEALNDTVKHRNGDQNLPIPKSIGDSVFINDLSYKEVSLAAQYMVELRAQFG